MNAGDEEDATTSSVVDRLTAIVGFSLLLERFGPRLDAVQRCEIAREIAKNADRLARPLFLDGKDTRISSSATSRTLA